MKRVIILLALAGTLLADPGRRDRSDWEGPPPPPPTSESRRMPTWAELHGSGYKPAKEPEPCDTPEPATIGLMGAGLLALMVAKNWRAR